MSFYTSLTGLNSATAQLAVTSNNIANVAKSRRCRHCKSLPATLARAFRSNR
jgi:flagellar basal body rod protein FlgC